MGFQPPTTMASNASGGASVSDWAIVVMTAVLAAITLYYAIQNRNMVAVMRVTRLDDADRHRRSDAARVAVWVEQLEFYSQREGRYVITARNGAAGPVHQMTVFLCGPSGESLGSAPWSVDVLPPGAEEQSPLTTFESKGGHLARHELRISATFTDGNGVRWTRMHNGRLLEGDFGQR